MEPITNRSRITLDPKILVGKPTIKGTRISVELVLKMLGQGIEMKEILEEYPDLEREDILAAIENVYPKSFRLF